MRAPRRRPAGSWGQREHFSPQNLEPALSRPGGKKKKKKKKSLTLFPVRVKSRQPFFDLLVKPVKSSSSSCPDVFASFPISEEYVKIEQLDFSVKIKIQVVD
ncbi:unnamed protein product [Bubo scandiacus]